MANKVTIGISVIQSVTKLRIPTKLKILYFLAYNSKLSPKKTVAGNWGVHYKWRNMVVTVSASMALGQWKEGRKQM